MNNDRINEVYRGEVSGPESGDAARERVHWVVEQARGRRVADVGCSQGIVGILLARRGFEVIGVDHEAPALAFAARELAAEEPAVRGRVRLVRAEGARLPLPDAAFDTVVLAEVIEHLGDPGPVLAEAARVLAPDGRLVLTTPFGLLPHDDHRRTYFLHSLVAAVAPRFRPLAIDVQDARFIRLVAAHVASRPQASIDLEGPLEEALLAKERRYLAELGALRESLTEANRKYRAVTGAEAQLKQRLDDANRKYQRATQAVSDLKDRLDAAVDGSDVAPLRERLEQAEAAARAAGREVAIAREQAEQRLSAAEAAIEQLARQASLADAERRRLEAELAAAAERNRRAETAAERSRREAAAATARADELGDDLARVSALKDAYVERYTNAVRSFQGQKQRILRLTTDLERARHRLGVIESSRSWRLVRRYWRLRQELLGGSGPQRRRFLADLVAAVRRRWGPPPRPERGYADRLATYLERVAADPARHFVLMFSGTTYIQEHRGNRPIRLARTLLEAKVPVLFSYWRWKRSEPLPADADPRLFQSPIDLTVDQLGRIARYPMRAKKRTFVVTFPHVSCARFLNVFNANGWVTVYDVRDDWEEFHKVGAAKWYNPALERYIANNVDVVTAVSRPLRDKIQAMLARGRVEMSPNALDDRFLPGRRVRVRPVDGRRSVGYVGHLTAQWFDWESLVAVAEREPGWRFEIVGHSLPADLRLPANVVYLGPRNHRQIMRRAARWRAAVIPFKVSKLADGVDPIKVYEYLAMGLPVVSFRMPQIHDYPYVLIAEGAEGLRRRLAEAFELPMDAGAIERFLAVNRWQDRADQLLAWRTDAPRTGHLAAIAGT